MQQSSSFAEILRQFRISRQYTQEELAEHARLGLDTISALERGTRVKPRKVTVTQLADALDLSESEQAVFFDTARGNSLNLHQPWQLLHFHRSPGRWAPSGEHSPIIPW
jgi:transcriptional regulator with XRE-family HTH domain